MVWVQLSLATPVVLWCGWPFFRRGWASVGNRRLNMFSLIALGTGIAYGYSLVAALLPEIFPRLVPHDGRSGAGLFRAGGGHRHPGIARAGSGTARPRPDWRCDPGIARPRAQSRARHRRRRPRGRYRARRGRPRQPPARAPWRESAGRRRRARREERGRRGDDHRGTRSGRKGSGRQGHRRHRQRHRFLRHAGRTGRQRHPAGPDRPYGCRGPALACADPERWPTPFPGGSCQESSPPRW